MSPLRVTICNDQAAGDGVRDPRAVSILQQSYRGGTGHTESGEGVEWSR